MAKASVVIVTYNGEKWIGQCLASLQEGKHALSVIVVDNASSDGTVAMVASKFPHVELITRSSNAGFGSGNNQGICAALDWGAEYVFLLNQDAYVVCDAIDALVDFMEVHREFGVTSPLHCSPNASQIDERTLQHYIYPFAGQYLSDACVGTARTYYAMRGTNAAAWMVRAETFRAAGGFDPMFFMYGEDEDLLDRWQRHGIGFALVPSARVVHLRERGPSAPGLQADLRRRASRVGSELRLQMKRAAYDGRPTWRPVVRVAVVQAIAAFIVERRGRELVANFLAAIGALREQRKVRMHALQCLQAEPSFLETGFKPVALAKKVDG